jgi:cation diffusion facilitator CzcD-associated flavoprotein CzcO
MTQGFASNHGSKTTSDDHHEYPEFSGESSHVDTPVRRIRVAILGTGFSGLGMAIQLKQHRYDDFVVIERSSGLGGTWRDNTYPGCACDIPSHLYSFSFPME